MHEKSNVSSLFNLKLVKGNQFLHWHSARRPRRHQALIKQLGGSYPIPSHKACSLISILRVMSDSDFWFTHPQDHRACNNLHEMELFPAKMWLRDFFIIVKLLFTNREVLWLAPFSRECYVCQRTKPLLSTFRVAARGLLSVGGGHQRLGWCFFNFWLVCICVSDSLALTEETQTYLG